MDSEQHQEINPVNKANYIRMFDRPYVFILKN